MITFKPGEPKDPLVELTKKLLKLLDVKVTSRTIEKTILRHPYYPGILALSDALSDWKVKNITLQIDESLLSLLTTIFNINLYPYNDYYLNIICRIRNDVVEFSHSMNEMNEIPLELITVLWSGVVMVLETYENSRESQYRRK